MWVDCELCAAYASWVSPVSKSVWAAIVAAVRVSRPQNVRAL